MKDADQLNGIIMSTSARRLCLCSQTIALTLMLCLSFSFNAEANLSGEVIENDLLTQPAPLASTPKKEDLREPSLSTGSPVGIPTKSAAKNADAADNPSKKDDDFYPPSSHRNIYNTPALVMPNQLSCGPSTVIVCHTQVSIPYPAAQGTVHTLPMPAPYFGTSFSVQCQNSNGFIAYEVINPSTISCELPRCASSSVNICGADVPIKGGISLGETITLPLPESVLGDNALYNTSTFTAICDESGDSKPVYRLVDTRQISCNAFPCADRTIHICGSSIPVRGGAHLGEVVHQTMPLPFVSDPFDVTCLGTLGHQPAYQLSDQSAVTCARAPVPPALTEP